MGNFFGVQKNVLASPEINSGAEINVRDDQTTYEFIEVSAEINSGAEINVRDDQTTYEFIEAIPEINTGPETSGTNAFLERRILPARAARDKSIFGNRGRSDPNNLKIKEPHALRAKRYLSCDSGLDKHKASVSKRGQKIKTTMNSRQASSENTSVAERNSRDKRSINAFGERRILPPRLAKEKSVFVKSADAQAEMHSIVLIDTLQLNLRKYALKLLLCDFIKCVALRLHYVPVKDRIYGYFHRRMAHKLPVAQTRHPSD
uniref:Uncharacterized protein n=1 Tax=Glossina pallidipes TaxID=7398 RepID=A0A1A9ZU19_GLOPL